MSTNSSFHVSNEALRQEDVPVDTANWMEVFAFAHRFDGYGYRGSTQECAEVAKRGENGTLTELRTRLFFLTRATNHGYGWPPPTDAEREHFRQLVARIRDKVAKSDLA